MAFLSSPSLRQARIVLILAVTQLIGWGTSFDMLGIFGRLIARDLNSPNEIIFFGAGVMMITGAVLAPKVGSWLKKHGAVPVLAAGSACLAAGLLVISLSEHGAVYFAGWVIIGFGGAFGLSAAAYAAVVERIGAHSKQAIGMLMILTGLSSAIFWPLMSWMEPFFGWRGVLAIMAGVHLFVCLPLHLTALPGPLDHKGEAGKSLERPPLPLSAQEKHRAFLLIAGATTLVSFVGFGISPNLLEIYHRSGATPLLALQLGSLRSVMGITARLGDMLLGRRITPVTTALAACLLMLLGLAVLVPGGAWAVLGFTLLYGMGSGMATLARVLLPLEFFAPAEYGLLASRLYLPQNIANALGPVAYTAVLDHGGPLPVIVMTIGLMVLALACVVLLAKLAGRKSLQGRAGPHDPRHRNSPRRALVR